MKFLIVDDDKSIVEAVTIGLQFQWQDAEVHSASDGEEGLRKFFDLSPDVTLLDVNMPHMSGFEVKPFNSSEVARNSPSGNSSI